MTRSTRADQLIKQINSRIDQIAREYGMDSEAFKALTKHLRGGDAPETRTSKSGVPHVRATAENRGDLAALEQIRRDLMTKSEIKRQAAAAGVKEDIFIEEYERASSNMDSRLQVIYGKYGPDTDEMPPEVKKQIDILHNEFNTKADVVRAFRVLDKYYED